MPLGGHPLRHRDVPAVGESADGGDGSPLTPSLTGPVALWMIVQIIPLVLSAYRVRLSAHYPAAGETLAFEMMVMVQLCAVALLAPVLLRSIGSTIAIALTAGPMLQLAGVLAQVSVGR